MMCEYCDGSEKPIIDVDGDGFDGGIAKVVGAELLVNWGDRLDRKGPMFVFSINACPMCGRELGSQREKELEQLVRDMYDVAARGEFDVGEEFKFSERMTKLGVVTSEPSKRLG